MHGKINKLGFSLMEIIFTLAIVSILALISIPYLRSMVQNYRLTGTTEQLYNALQLARVEAIKRNTNVYVTFTTGDSWCYGINPSSACNCQIAGNCTLGAFSAPKPAQLTLTTSYVSSLYFEPTHSAANASGTVTFTVYGGTTLMTITVGRLGNPQICATGVSGYTAC